MGKRHSVIKRLVAIAAIGIGANLPLAGLAAGLPAAIVRVAVPPVVDGELGDWAGITATHAVFTALGEQVATFRLAADTEHLHVAFEVVDDSPMRNTAAALEELIKGGDAVGIFLGPVNGRGRPQRIMAAEVAGRPVAMAYRPSWPAQRPYTFSSPVSDLRMDYVGPVDGARVAFRRGEHGYVAELALPWAGLGLPADFAGDLPFDVQVIFSDPAGSVNVEAAWWHATDGPGFTTEDLPTEAALHPGTWGVARLFDNDPGPRRRRAVKGVAQVGVPISFTLPRAARASLLVVDGDGWIVRELLRAERLAAGSHTVHWNGRDRYDEVLPPGDYRWRLAYFDGMGSRFHGSVGNSARPPFRTADGSGSMGGQHGGPSVIGADAGGIYVIGGAEEGHPAMRKIDRDGYTLWKRSMGGFGSGLAVATVGEELLLIQSPSRGGMFLVRLAAATGAELPLAPGVPRLTLAESRRRVGGLAVVGERAYFSLPEENCLGVVNLATGAREADIAIERPLGLAATADGRLLVCSGQAVLALAADGGTTTVVDGLAAPRAVAVAADGRLYVSDLGSSQQVKIFAGGRQVGVIGVAGGRPATVLEYDRQALRNVVGLAVDGAGTLWVVEQSPLRRVARFSAAGECEMELFGPVAYNVFGPDLDDFATVYYQTSQGSPVYAKARLDYDAYRADPVRGGTDGWRIESVFDFTQAADPEAGELDLLTAPMSPGYGHVVAFTAANGHRYLWRLAKSNRATQPTGAAIWRWAEDGWRPAAFVANRADGQSWADANGDGRVQADELYGGPPTNRFAWLDRDLTLYGWSGTLKPARIDERGVPDYRDGAYASYLDPNERGLPGGWVFNSMPDAEGAVYYAVNLGPHRHRTAWDRAAENQIVKVQDGRVQWLIGNNDPLLRQEGDMNTVTGIAGIVDDILIAHIVEPANYIAFTTDGFTLGNVIVDAAGQRPRVGANAIYIESFTGLFLRDPASGKRLLFAVSSGDDRILEVTGPGEIVRLEGTVRLDSSLPREAAPVGETAIPYETWWGSQGGRDHRIDANDWEWTRRSAGLSVIENGAVVGDVRLRRDAGFLYVLANAVAWPEAAGASVPAAETAWGTLPGVELLLAPLDLPAAGKPQAGAYRLFLTVHEGRGVALLHQAGEGGWQAIRGAQVALKARDRGYGWRLEAELPLAALAGLAEPRWQRFRRGNPVVENEEERHDLVGPLRFNAALHLAAGAGVRRVPWVEDGTEMEAPGALRPARWGYANAMVEVSWVEPSESEMVAIFRAPVERPTQVVLVSAAATGGSLVDTPGPGDFLYWVAPVSAAGMIGQPVGPVRARESRVALPAPTGLASAEFGEGGDWVVSRRQPVGLRVVTMPSERLQAMAPPPVTVATTRLSAAQWLVAAVLPAKPPVGQVLPIRLEAREANGPSKQASFELVVGLDLLAELALGPLRSAAGAEDGWRREPEVNVQSNAIKHLVTMVDGDGLPAPCLEMEAWNSDNTVTYPFFAPPTRSYWRTNGHLRVLGRAGNTTISVRIRDAEGRPIAELRFASARLDGRTVGVVEGQGQRLVAGDEENRPAVDRWQPFEIVADGHGVRLTYGSGRQQRVVEAVPLAGADWRQPASLEIQLGGRTSGRHLRVDNLRFVSK